MKYETAVCILWPLALALFLAGIVANRWGVDLQLGLMSPANKTRADVTLMHALWIGRSVKLWMAAAVTGVAGLVCAWKATRVHGPFPRPPATILKLRTPRR